MKFVRFFVISILWAAAFTASAGTLENDVWSPAGCGAMPEAPVIQSGSVEAFNKSIATINAWQEQLQAYHDCMVKEANADSATINRSATAEQTRIEEAIEKLNAETAKARQEAERKASSPSPSLAPPAGSAPGTQGY
ncbi:MAG: hypothetical protein H0X43_02700 [Nitrosospira sp.]|nr:hypothetical protein [Nitrosospira sp.]